jgi:hypothetical protein
MEETRCRFYRLRDDLTYYIAAQLDKAVIKSMYGEYQDIWDQVGERRLEYRRTPEPG